MDDQTAQAVAGATAAINGISANIGSKKEMKRAQQYNLETMEKQNEYWNKNYERQRDDAYAREDWLNANAKAIEVNAMRAAGLNPAWSAEGAGQLVSSSIGSADGSAPSGSGIAPSGASKAGIEAFNSTYGTSLQAIMNRSLLEQQSAQTSLIRTQEKKVKAEKEQIEQDTIQSSNRFQWEVDENIMSSYSFLRGLHTDANGKFVDADGKEVDWNNNAFRPNTSKRGIHALHSFEEFQRDSSVYQSSALDSKLKALVSSLQIDSPDVLRALSNISVEQYKSLVAETDDKVLENEINRLSRHVISKFAESDSELVKVIGCIIYNLAQSR